MLGTFIWLTACAEKSGETTIAVTTTFLGETIACGVRLNDEITAKSGEVTRAKPGTYTVTIGDDNASSDDVPRCTTANKTLVRPPLTAVLSEGETAEIEAPTNLYIDGTWTCRNEDGATVTDVARYLGGQFLSMPGVMLDMVVEGRAVRYEDSTISVSGIIDTNSATFDLENASNDFWSITCMKNDP